MNGRNHLPWQLAEPIGSDVCQCRTFKWRVKAAAAEERVSDELGVPLPLEAEDAKVMREVVQARLWRGHSVALAEFDENSVVLGCTEFIAGKSKMRDPFGRLQSRERPCVELIVEQVTEWVIAKLGALNRAVLQRLRGLRGLRYESFGSACGCVESADGL